MWWALAVLILLSEFTVTTAAPVDVPWWVLAIAAPLALAHTLAMSRNMFLGAADHATYNAAVKRNMEAINERHG